jgi:formylglycine-generating enzyme required for sulfatase activity
VRSTLALAGCLLPALAAATTVRVERIAQGAGPERVPPEYLPGLTREVEIALRGAGRRVVREGGDEIWGGRLSVQTKRYAKGRVFRLELERRDAAGRLLGAGDKFAELHYEYTHRLKCPNVERARSIYCGYQHMKYIARWLARHLLRDPERIEVAPAANVVPPAGVPGMVYVPAGEFVMGGDFGEFDEEPRHKVWLDAFYIDKNEVTNEEYRRCVRARRCRRSLADGDRRYNGPRQPVVSISWHDARAYCAFAGGKRLPTEAEWEKAARGTDERRYPWGNELRRECVNLRDAEDGFRHTAPVGSFPCGASPYGALDMAGNAWEWCEDWWDGGYYRVSPARNPKGPPRSPRGRRCMRGGTWKYEVGFFVTTTNRSHTFPTKRTPWVGFRCAKGEGDVLRERGRPARLPPGSVQPGDQSRSLGK